VKPLDRDVLDRAIERLESQPIHVSPRVAAPLAEAHRLRGEPARAVEIARAGLASFPDHRGILCVLARSLADAGEPTPSREAYAELLRLDPQNIEARACLGLASRTAADAPADAPPEVAAEGPLAQTIPEGLAHLDGLFSARGDSGDAAPEQSIATLTLAEIYARQGLRAKAIEVCERILRDRPDDDEAKERLEEYRRIPAQVI